MKDSLLQEALLGMVGKAVSCFCASRIYAGRLVSVGCDYILMDSVASLPADAKKHEDVNEAMKQVSEIPGEHLIPLAAIECIGKVVAPEAGRWPPA